jgi:hypothetical protein
VPAIRVENEKGNGPIRIPVEEFRVWLYGEPREFARAHLAHLFSRHG